ncbi:MAG: hydroxyacid dehydrogenase [Planctomycetaceae bacterium]|nr:hydroxyacid dehydrogenase [Planctomycetaceae bacterium]
MKVLIADKFPERYIEQIRGLGSQVSYEPRFEAAEIVENIADKDVVVVRSTKVTAEAIEATQNLSLIIRAGAGTNNIDKQAASCRGVYVANCPGMNSIAVAELAMGLICALDRRIVENTIDLRNGIWNKAEYSQADGLYGKVLGVVGVGKIGEELIKRARVFGFQLKAYSRSLTPDKAKAIGVACVPSVAELVPQCDIISVHLAAAPETEGIISKEIIDSMKPGAYFINTARAELVDEAALLEAVQAGRIRVGTDLYRDEPEGKTAAFESELSKAATVYGTHHIGASTTQAQNAVAAETVRILKLFLKTGRVENWVNRLVKTPANWQLVVRHHDKPGVLAAVLSCLKEDNVNAEEIENVIFEGAQAACCTIQVDTKPSSETLEKISALEGQVIHSELMGIG